MVCGFNYNVATPFEFLDRRRRLQTPAEQSQLLENVPTVMRDAYEPNDCDVKTDRHGSPDSYSDTQRDHASPSGKKLVDKQAKAKGGCPHSDIQVIDVNSDSDDEGEDGCPASSCCLPTNRKTEADP